MQRTATLCTLTLAMLSCDQTYMPDTLTPKPAKLNATARAVPDGYRCLADLDFDGDVDPADYAVFAACFNGGGNVPACSGPTVLDVQLGAANFSPEVRSGIRQTILENVYFIVDAKNVYPTWAPPDGACMRVGADTDVGRLEWKGCFSNGYAELRGVQP